MPLLLTERASGKVLDSVALLCLNVSLQWVLKLSSWPGLKETATITAQKRKSDMNEPHIFHCSVVGAQLRFQQSSLIDR